MPVYEYECRDCGYAWEERLQMGTPHPAVCVDCGSRRVHQVYSPPVIVFQGSGFHQNDYDAHGPRIERDAASG